jgi:hypothetical protein
MPALLTTLSKMSCPHGGTVTASPAGTVRAKADGALLRSTDSFSITGCTFTPGTNPQPCTTVQWVETAEKVKHGGTFVLNEASVGLCLGPAPQGNVMIDNTQAKVAGL